MPFPDPYYEATVEAINDPQIGDRFSEMYSFFIYVINVEDGIITTLEASPPCTLPQDGKLRAYPHEEFKERLSYGGSVDGYWARLADRENNVDGWLTYKLMELIDAPSAKIEDKK